MGAGGRPRNIESQEVMQFLFEGFEQELKEEAKGWPKIQYVGKDGQRVEDYPRLPLTMEGFYDYAYRKGYGLIKQYFVNDSEMYPEFLTICSCIKNKVRKDQIIGGLIGQFNQSITQRLNSLTEKTETDNKISGDISVNFVEK